MAGVDVGWAGKNPGVPGAGSSTVEAAPGLGPVGWLYTAGDLLSRVTGGTSYDATRALQYAITEMPTRGGGPPVLTLFREWALRQRPPVVTPPPGQTPDTMPPVSQANLPAVRGFPGVDILPQFALPGLRSFVLSGVGLAIATLLLWPREVGRGSDLRDLYAVAAARPRARPTPGGRTRGRRRTVPPLTRPTSVRPRTSTPKVLSRTVVRAPPTVLEAVRGRPPRVPAPVAAPSAPPRAAPVPSTHAPPTARTVPTAGTLPTSVPVHSPVLVPSGVPAAAPPTTLPAPLVIGLSLASSLLSAATVPRTMPRIRPPQPSPTPSPAPSPLPVPLPALQPLTQAYSSAVPYPRTAEKECSCARTRKRSKDRCTNPITRKTKRERDGATYITTTRRIECQA